MASAQAVSERWLLLRYRRYGDLGARERLVELLMPLVHSVAARYHHPRFGDDLTQAASLGLVKAIERWDERRGRELRSYAIPTMHGEVRRWLRDNAWAVHMPRPLQETVLAVTKATEELRRRDGRSPTATQVAERLALPLEEVLDALQAGRAYGAASLDATVGDEAEAATLADVVGADDVRLEWAEYIAALGPLRPLLDDREREMLRLRFVEDLTQAQIAMRVGCSQMQVSRVLRRALERLNARIGAPVP